MGRISGATSRIYFDEVNLSGVLNAIDEKVDVDLPEVTCFSDAAKVFVEGKQGFTLALNGFADTADDGWDEVSLARFGDGSDHYVGHYPGSSAGNGWYGREYVVRMKSQPRSSKVGEAVLLNIECQGQQPIVRSIVLLNQAVTGTLNGSGQDVGTSTSGQKTVAVVRVLAVSGSGSLAVAIQESSDNGGSDAFATISGMTATLTALGATRLTSTAATERYKRIIVSSFSGFTSVTLMCAIGREYA